MLVVVAVAASSCTTLKEVANLRKVDFSLEALRELRVADIDVSRIGSYEDLGALDVVKVGAAVARGQLPVSFTLDVGARNPEENGVQARLVRFDWTLLIEDRATVSGVFEDEVILPAGDARMIPVRISLDLIEFFDRNAPDLVDLALSLSGQGGEPKNVALRATPTIDTLIGPVRYPEPITIISGTVG